MELAVVGALVTVGVVLVGVMLRRTHRGFTRAVGRRQRDSTGNLEGNNES